MFPEAPVLLVTFNRPETTIEVFRKIKQAKVRKLYFFNDGPRQGNEKDSKAREEIRTIVEMVDWDCELHTNFSEENLGCGPGVSSAITWAFEKEDRLIVLEDDFVPAISFFNYCHELLEKYKDDTRVWWITGNNYSEEKKIFDYDYFFTTYGHSQGWATWKRSWEHFDLKMSKFPIFRDTFRKYDSYHTKKEANFFFPMKERLFENEYAKSHQWASQFGFIIRANGGLCITPRKNLVTNIGYMGTHSGGANSTHNIEVDENFIVKKHPDFVLVNKEYDLYHFKTYWKKMKKNIFQKVVRKIGKWYKQI
ncbi:hypothetical protein JEZ13_08840 [bacterium]|nr:hypothetical protein [bacterium]